MKLYLNWENFKPFFYSSTSRMSARVTDIEMDLIRDGWISHHSVLAPFLSFRFVLFIFCFNSFLNLLKFYCQFRHRNILQASLLNVETVKNNFIFDFSVFSWSLSHTQCSTQKFLYCRLKAVKFYFLELLLYFLKDKHISYKMRIYILEIWVCSLLSTLPLIRQ